MKRLTLLFLVGALASSAQEVRLTKAAMLRSERSIVSLRAGTIVDVLARDEGTVTVRYNNVTGMIPASSLTAVRNAKPAEAKPAAPAQKAGSPYVRAGNKARENVANSEQNGAKQLGGILAAN